MNVAGSGNLEARTEIKIPPFWSNSEAQCE